jgi:hypothetical protein
MTIRPLPIAIALPMLLACFDSDDARQALADIRCDGAQCSASWDGSTERSRVYPESDIAELPEANAPAQWSRCAREIDVDICLEVDGHGRVACFWVQDGWVVAVAPVCMVDGLEDWRHVGLGMAARVFED